MGSCNKCIWSRWYQLSVCVWGVGNLTGCILVKTPRRHFSNILQIDPMWVSEEFLCVSNDACSVVEVLKFLLLIFFHAKRLRFTLCNVWMDDGQLLCFGQCLWSLRLQQSLLVRPWFQQHIRLSTSQLHSVVSLGWKSSTHQKNIMGRFMFPRSPTYLWL